MKRLLLAAVLAGFLTSASAQNAFRLFPETGGQFNSSIRLAPTYVNARSLAASASETSAVPAGSRWVLFSGACDFYAKTGASAAIPGDVTDGTAAELNPAGWYIEGATQITVISAVDCVVTLAFYR